MQDDPGHVDGALMMGNHALHEVAVNMAGQQNVHVGVHFVVGCLEGLRRRRGGGSRTMMMRGCGRAMVMRRLGEGDRRGDQQNSE